MSAHANIESLAWETEFFGQSTARLNLSDTLSPQQRDHLLQQMADYAIVQAKVSAERTDLIDTLSGLNFALVEGEIDLTLMIGTENAYLDSVTISLNSAEIAVSASVDEIPLLRQAAKKVFVQSRFRAPWYQPEDSGRFYALWLEKAVLGTFDHQCLLVKSVSGEIEGFVTLRHLDEDSARIGLLAVMPGVQGKGIGKKLMSAALQWCQQHQKKQLKVATQVSNIAALRLYTRSGAQIATTAYWLYRGQYDPI